MTQKTGQLNILDERDKEISFLSLNIQYYSIYRLFHIYNAYTRVFFRLHVVRVNFILIIEFRPVSVWCVNHICVNQNMHVALLLCYFPCRSKRNLFIRIMHVKKYYSMEIPKPHTENIRFFMVCFISVFGFEHFRKKPRSTILMRVEHLSDGRNESLRIKVYGVK